MDNPVSLRFSHSHHLLMVKDCSSVLDVLTFQGDEALSTPFRYRIEFTSQDRGISREAILMKPAALTLQASTDQGFGIKVQQPVRVIQGVVNEFERLGTSKDETHYALTIQPRLALLACSHQSAVYQDMSVPQIVEKILRERHGMRGQDFLFSLVNEYPRREQVMQYGESDLRFISRLLGEVGIWFRFITDSRLHIDVVEFYDSQQGYEKGLTMPSVPPSGQLDNSVESVWSMESRYQVVEKQVSTRDYNYRNALEDMDVLADVTCGDITTYGEAYHYADNYLTAGEMHQRNPLPESGAFYAGIRHERYLNGQTRLSGITSSAALAPGKVLKVTGGSEVTDIFARGVVVTRLVSRARRDRAFEISFEGIPDNHEYAFRPLPPPRPVMAGTLPARVTSTVRNDTYAHIDREGRYRVNMLFDRANWETGFESLWVRQARPYAGDTYGLHLPLLAGTEVAIGFEDGNPDRPYIAGVLHDSAHSDHVTIRNYKRNVLRTPKNNKIRLDDSENQQHIKISTEYAGKSQMSLGHLVDGERQKRGEGAELRTDAWAAIRGGKGLLLTTQAQPRAMAQQLSMDEIRQQLSDALSLATSMSLVLKNANIDPLDDSAQKSFLQQSVDNLQQPAIVAGAPAGIALSTPRHIQLSASSNQMLTAGGSTEISAFRRIVIAAKKAVAVFAQEMGMKLVAAAGKIEVEAQTDGIDITAVKGLSVTSTDDEIIISAKKKITLQCGGSYITIDPVKIENGTNGSFKVRSADFDYAGPASLNVPYPKFTVCKNIAAEAANKGDATFTLS